LQNEGQSSLYKVLKNYVPSGVLKKKNSSKTWLYGYNEKYDLVVISKSGQIGDIISISGLVIALPLAPKEIFKRDKNKRRSNKENENLFV